MISVAHFIFGLALAYVLDRRLVTASTFALVPDFDITFDFLYPFVHRGIMHSFLAAGAFTILVYAYTEDRFSAESCFIGYNSHFALDILTPSGLKLFFPFLGTFSLSLTYANNLTYNSAIIAFSLSLMIVKKNFESIKPLLNIR